MPTISGQPDDTGATLDGTELLPATVSGVTGKIRVSQIVDLALASGGSGATSAAKSASFTTISGVAHYDLDTASVAITVTMNAAPAANDVVEIWDATGHAATNVVSFDGNGHTISGSSTLTGFIAVNFGHARLRFNGTQWLIT